MIQHTLVHWHMQEKVIVLTNKSVNFHFFFTFRRFWLVLELKFDLV
jgi:hypothetical protein